MLQLLNIVASVLTIVALGIAAWQTYEARKQTKALQEIHQSLTTRYLGPYPEFLSTIIPILESAKTSLIILTDCPAYAGFTNPDQEQIARQAIERKLGKHNFKVTLIFRDEKERRAITRLQFAADDGAWDAWKAHQSHRDLLKQFFGDAKDLDKLTLAEFEDAIEKNDQTVLTSFRHFAKIQDQGNVQSGRVRFIEDPRHIPVNFWIADGKRAVFSLISAGQDPEYGFETSDARLIASLERVAEDLLGARQATHLSATPQPPALPPMTTSTQV